MSLLAIIKKEGGEYRNSEGKLQGAISSRLFGKGKRKREKKNESGDQKRRARHRQEGADIDKHAEKKPKRTVFFLRGEKKGGRDQHGKHRCRRCPSAPADEYGMLDNASAVENNGRAIGGLLFSSTKENYEQPR